MFAQAAVMLATSVGLCFGYWFLSSILVYGAAFACAARLTLQQAMSTMVRTPARTHARQLPRAHQ